MEKQDALEPDRASINYRAAVLAVRGIYAAVPKLRLTSSGLENLPAKDPYVLAFTHHNSHDIPTIGTVVYQHSRRPIHFLTAEELLPANLKSGSIMKYANYINYELDGPLSFLSKHALNSMHARPINRDRPAISQTKEALRLLRDGHILGIAPEGGRYDGDEVAKELKDGAGRFAVAENVALVPVAVAGQNWRHKKAKKEGQARWYLPRSVHVHIGEPIETEGLRRSELDQINQLLQPALQRALKESYYQYQLHNGLRAASRLDRS